MQSPKPEIDNLEKFGKLIEDWANGRQTRPLDIQDMLGQAAARKITITLPTNTANLNVEFLPENTLSVIVPHANFITECRNYLKSLGDPSAYPLSSYYLGAFECDEGPHNLIHRRMSDTEKEAFMLQRIGEYTMNICM